MNTPQPQQVVPQPQPAALPPPLPQYGAVGPAFAAAIAAPLEPMVIHML